MGGSGWICKEKKEWRKDVLIFSINERYKNIYLAKHSMFGHVLCFFLECRMLFTLKSLRRYGLTKYKLLKVFQSYF